MHPPFLCLLLCFIFFIFPCCPVPLATLVYSPLSVIHRRLDDCEEICLLMWNIRLLCVYAWLNQKSKRLRRCIFTCVQMRNTLNPKHNMSLLFPFNLLVYPPARALEKNHTFLLNQQKKIHFIQPSFLSVSLLSLSPPPSLAVCPALNKQTCKDCLQCIWGGGGSLVCRGPAVGFLFLQIMKMFDVTLYTYRSVAHTLTHILSLLYLRGPTIDITHSPCIHSRTSSSYWKLYDGLSVSNLSNTVAVWVTMFKETCHWPNVFPPNPQLPFFRPP